MTAPVQKSGDPTETEIEALIRDFQSSPLVELHVKTATFEIFLSKDADRKNFTSLPQSRSLNGSALARPAEGSTEATAPPSVANIASKKPAAPSIPKDPPEGCVAVRAPYQGTFYRAPKPGEPNFVDHGARVNVGADLCLVEVMKLFTAVRTDQAGVIREIYASDGQMVEEGQLLFAIEPEG